MPLQRILIANRGEIAIRVARAAATMGVASVAVFAEDDAGSPHVSAADEAVGLSGTGVAAYLNIEGLVAAAKARGCDGVHPGYGFLAENAAFATACHEAGLTFIGPSPELLTLFGTKDRARAFAEMCGVPVLPGLRGPATLEQVSAFLAAQGEGGGIIIKALAGGGGRGMRPVLADGDVSAAFRACEGEALAAFGSGGLYAERLVREARHIEVQIIGDGTSQVSHLWERDCSLQRRNQKLVEIAPAPFLELSIRDLMLADAVRMASKAGYRGLGTFEFLLDIRSNEYFFIEANPRVQVEHTVTEEVTGVDLVTAQIAIAGGVSLNDLSLTQTEIAEPRGLAIQCRINAETLLADGTTRPGGGLLQIFEPPSGPGVRVDTAARAGLTTSPHYDSLLAKVIVHNRSGDWLASLRQADRALAEFRIAGVSTNLTMLRALLAADAVQAGRMTTAWVEANATDLVARAETFAAPTLPPSAVGGPANTPKTAAFPADTEPVRAPLRGTLVGMDVAEGDIIRPGQIVAILEAMKMQHEVRAGRGGSVAAVLATVGDTIDDGEPLLAIRPDASAAGDTGLEESVDLDAIRPDLAAVLHRQALTRDEQRPDAVARRRKTGQRTARENINDLLDPGSFVEYGSLVLAAQRRRRTQDELIAMSPADGLVMGTGAINGTEFDEAHARVAVLAYDYTVFAGTQGHANHKKTDRMLALAADAKLPVVWFTEGGGGRPGDTVDTQVAGLDVMSFRDWAAMSGLAPRIAINSGRCFAGNAVMFGLADVTIATANSTIGLGGPAMIEGGGLGVFTPEEVGPMDMQTANGVVDIAVADEAEAVAAARQWLSYFQGTLRRWTCADQRLLRHAIPENRLRVYEIRKVIETLADTGTFLELRRAFGPGMITALIRIEGRPMGLLANDPAQLGGAIDSDGADKAARFMQLCNAFGLPILNLCDTPGFMVGPASEATAAVRKGSRMFIAAASLRVPTFTVILRKGYGLGAQAMAGGSFGATFFTVAWPTGEIGGMGLEGAVRLGYRKELEAETDPNARQALFEKLVARLYEGGKAMSAASVLEIDDVIDPVDTRRWIVAGLKAQPKRPEMPRLFIDTW